MSFLVFDAIGTDHLLILSYLMYISFAWVVLRGFEPAQFKTLTVFEDDRLWVITVGSVASRNFSYRLAWVKVESHATVMLVLSFLEDR